MSEDHRPLERRVIGLERQVTNLGAMLKDVLLRLTAAEQKALGASVGSGAGGGGGGGGLLAKTPGGGIAACTGTTFPYAPGSATCELGTFDGTHVNDAMTTATIYNMGPAVAPNKLIQVKQIGAYLWVDVEPC